MFLGDRNPGDTVELFFNTIDSSNAPITLIGGTVSIYKDGGTTEGTAGVTLMTDFDGKTGLHRLAIDTSADGTFYAAGSDFIAFLSAGTVDGISYVGAQLGHFSLQNRQVTVRSVLSGAIAAASFAANALDAVWSTATRVLTAGTNIALAKGTGVTGFNDLSAAQVNTEVVDALATDTYAEPGQGSPAATLSLAAKINYLFKAWRNKITQTSSQYSLYADDAATVDQKATVSDDATTFTRGEIASGP